jgi:hypothetical protein
MGETGGGKVVGVKTLLCPMCRKKFTKTSDEKCDGLVNGKPICDKWVLQKELKERLA